MCVICLCEFEKRTNKINIKRSFCKSNANASTRGGVVMEKVYTFSFQMSITPFAKIVILDVSFDEFLRDNYK